MVTLNQIFKSNRDFMSLVDIKNWLDNECDDEFELSDGILIFDSITQHTWLIATNKALYCVFDLIRDPYPKINWKIEKEKIIKNDEITLSISTQKNSDLSGSILIDNKKPRKFSYGLFKTISIESSIKNLLKKSFLSMSTVE